MGAKMTNQNIATQVKEAIKLLEPRLPNLYPHLDIKMYCFLKELHIEFKPKRYNSGHSKNITTISNRIGLFRRPFYSVNANIIHLINECIKFDFSLQEPRK